MIAAELTAATVVFGFALWLGLYLIGRDVWNVALRLAGGGIVAYALVWAFDAVARIPPDRPLSPQFARVRWPLQFLPVMLWTGALIALVPETGPLRALLYRIWRIVVLAFIIAAGAAIIFDWQHTGLVTLFFGLLVLVPLLLATLLVWRAARMIRPQRTVSVLLVSALFFTLSSTLLLVPPGGVPRVWLLALVGVDILFLGFVIAVLDAFDQGEALLADIVASLDAACVSALLFGGQVALVMVLATGPTRPLVVLLLATVATAVSVSVFADPLREIADRLALGRFPQHSAGAEHPARGGERAPAHDDRARSRRPRRGGVRPPDAARPQPLRRPAAPRRQSVNAAAARVMPPRRPPCTGRRARTSGGAEGPAGRERRPIETAHGWRLRHGG